MAGINDPLIIDMIPGHKVFYAVHLFGFTSFFDDIFQCACVCKAFTYFACANILYFS
jgi:hypothetical protein